MLLASVCEHMLEKDKRYELSCVVYVRLLLLSKLVKSNRRAKWWVRLAVDIKHIKMRKECLNITEVALQDIAWVKTGPKS